MCDLSKIPKRSWLWPNKTRPKDFKEVRKRLKTDRLANTTRRHGVNGSLTRTLDTMELVLNQHPPLPFKISVNDSIKKEWALIFIKNYFKINLKMAMVKGDFFAFLLLIKIGVRVVF